MTAESKDPFEAARQTQRYRIQAHAKKIESESFQAEMMGLKRISLDFAAAVSACAFYSTRIPSPQGELLTFARADDLIESSLAIMNNAQEGFYNPARREKRYLIEAALKYVATDQQVPDLTIRKRIGHFERKVQYSSPAPLLNGLSLGLLSKTAKRELKEEVENEYDALSSYVHASALSVRERQSKAAKGEYVGFEGEGEVAAFAAEVARSLDIALAVTMHALHPGLLGDLFVLVFDHARDWAFRSTKYVAEVSAYFDYKAERQERLPAEESE